MLRLILCFVCACAPFLQRAAAVQCVEGDYSALSAYLWPHTDSLSAAACNHHHHHHPYHKNHDRCHYHLHHLFITMYTQTYICHLSSHVRMRMRRLGGFAKKWVTKVLFPPEKIRIFGPKTAILPQNMHFWANIGPAVSFGALLIGWVLVVAHGLYRKSFYLIYLPNCQKP